MIIEIDSDYLEGKTEEEISKMIYDKLNFKMIRAYWFLFLLYKL